MSYATFVATQIVGDFSQTVSTQAFLLDKMSMSCGFL